MVELTVATPADCDELGKTMRHPNLAEYLRAMGVTAEELLREAIETSRQAWACRIDGELVALGGFIPDSFTSDSAMLWIHTGMPIERHQKAFLRACRQWLEESLGKFRRLYVIVDERFSQSLRLVRWLGFLPVEKRAFDRLKTSCLVMEITR